MKNREKYKDELIKMCGTGHLGGFYCDYVEPFYGIKWRGVGDDAMAILTTLWLDEEYVEPIEPWEGGE